MFLIHKYNPKRHYIFCIMIDFQAAKEDSVPFLPFLLCRIYFIFLLDILKIRAIYNGRYGVFSGFIDSKAIL